jgi:hypothetical protein
MESPLSRFRNRKKSLTVVPKPEKIVQVSCTWLNIIGVDSVNQTFQADIVIRLTWHEELTESLVKLFPQATTNVHGGKAAVELKDFVEHVWDPQFQFPNCRSMEDTEQWVRMERHETHAKVVWAIRFRCGQFTCLFDLRTFPFDQQALFIRISSGWDERKVQFVTAPKDACRETYEDYNLMDYDLIANRIADVYSTDSRDARYLCRSDTSSSNSGVRYNSIFLIQTVLRQPGFYVLNLYLPTLLISSSAFTAFVFYVEDFGGRSTVLMTLLLTVVAFKQVIGQNLPRLPYITYLDRYALVSLALVVVIGVMQSALSTAAVCVEAPTRKPTLCMDVLPSLDHRSVDHADYVCLVVVSILWTVYQFGEIFLILKARHIEQRGAALEEVKRENHQHDSPGLASNGTEMATATKSSSHETKVEYTPVP